MCYQLQLCLFVHWVVSSFNDHAVLPQVEYNMTRYLLGVNLALLCPGEVERR